MDTESEESAEWPWTGPGTYPMFQFRITLENCKQEWANEPLSSYSEFDDVIEDFLCNEPIRQEIILNVQSNYWDMTNFDEWMILCIYHYRDYIFNRCTDEEKSDFFARVEQRKADRSRRLIEEYVAENSDEEEPLFPIGRKA